MKARRPLLSVALLGAAWAGGTQIEQAGRRRAP
jgi:hypothetical protein